MGNTIKTALNYFSNNIFFKPLQIVMIGLDGAGKTTILYRLKLKEDVHTTVPTAAFNVETVRPFKNLKFLVWDTSGTDVLRPLWKAYVRKSDGIIFVIDSSDCNRFDETKVELDNILNSNESKGIPLLILANKQDIKNSIPPIKLAQRLELDSLDISVNWHIYPTAGRCGGGLQDAMIQLADMINIHRKKNLNKNSKLTTSNTNGGFHAIEASTFI